MKEFHKIKSENLGLLNLDFVGVLIELNSKGSVKCQ